MEEHKSKQRVNLPGEVTDSGFCEEQKGFDDVWQQSSSSLYVRSPSYEQKVKGEDDSSNDAQRQLREQDEDGNTYLHNAIIDGQEGYACRIINATASKDTLELKNRFGETPLVLSMAHRMYAAVWLLIDAGVDLQAINYQIMNNVLHIAASNGDEKMLELLIAKADAAVLKTLSDQVNEEGHIPLHISTIKKDMGCCKLLILMGSDVDFRDHRSGFTSLHHAVLSGDVNFLMKFIGNFQPDFDVTSYAEETPFDLANENDFEAVKAILMDAAFN